MSFYSLSDHFQLLDVWLSKHKALWQCVPFNHSDLPWWNDHPQLCHWLMSLSLVEAQQLKSDPIALISLLSDFIPCLDEGKALMYLPASSVCHQHQNQRIQQGIPGRKWQQIVHFDQTLPLSDSGKWLEWCAGKGFLGRVISTSREAPVVSLELQQALCNMGEAYARQHQIPMQFVQQNVFESSSRNWVNECDHAIALHACGDLHVTLLRHCAYALPKSVTISPCCYHLIQSNEYQALSCLAKKASLTLSKLDLKLPLHETVTAGKTVRDKREIEMRYRLGFDALQRELGISNAYLPVPTIQKSLLNASFADFCHWAAMKKGIQLPDPIDMAYFESLGHSRFILMERIDVIQTVFKRPLEIWLALDRALYMEENGYRVSITQFCERALTPRNILIQARLK